MPEIFFRERGSANGPSTHILSAPAKCNVPWHYHTAEEQLVVIRGSVVTEMDGMRASTLGAGGFALMPSKKHHQAKTRPKTESCWRARTSFMKLACFKGSSG